jgi:hypothetical protein
MIHGLFVLGTTPKLSFRAMTTGAGLAANKCRYAQRFSLSARQQLP